MRQTMRGIVDLIEWGRGRGNTEERVQTFRTVAELRAYTKSTGKNFSQHVRSRRRQHCPETFTSQDIS